MKKYSFNSAQLREMLALGDEDRQRFVSYIESIETADQLEAVECPDVEVVRQFAHREQKRRRRQAAATERRRLKAQEAALRQPPGEEIDYDTSRLATDVTFTQEDLKYLTEEASVHLCWLSRVADQLVDSAYRVFCDVSQRVCRRVQRFMNDFRQLVRALYKKFFDTPLYRLLSPRLPEMMFQLQLPLR